MLLFKVDDKNRIRTIDINYKGSEIIRSSGILGGKTTQNFTQCHPKNIGKSNYKSAETNAREKTESIIKEKIRDGYVQLTQDELSLGKEQIIEIISKKANSIPKPMLASVLNPNKVSEKFKALGSAKLDGMRAIVVIPEVGDVKMYSRKSVEITTMNHIINELEIIRNNSGFVGVLDGELYNHELKKDFQDLMSACKKEGELTKKIQYHVSIN